METLSVIMVGSFVGAATLTGIVSIRELREVSRNCEEIVRRCDERIAKMPRSMTCSYSEVPNGRTFCNYFRKCCIAHCRRCEHYDNKFN